MSLHATVVTSPLGIRPITVRATAIGYARQFWYAMRRCWWSSYWRLEVEGLENVPRRGPVLLCGNHTSHLDAPAILAALPRDLALRTSTAAAKDVFGDVHWRDVVSRVIANALPIERGAGFSRGLRELETVLHERRPLIIFPEGRRSTNGTMFDFKPGAAMLALRTGTPIVPLHIAGADGSLPRGACFPKPHDVSVRFGQSIDPRPFIDAVEARTISKREAYDRITATLREDILALARGPRRRRQDTDAPSSWRRDVAAVAARRNSNARMWTRRTGIHLPPVLPPAPAPGRRSSFAGGSFRGELLLQGCSRPQGPPSPERGAV